jgi:hypothetical protein
MNTYDEGLVECEYDNELDREKLGKWTTASKLLFCQTIEEQKTI